MLRRRRDKNQVTSGEERECDKRRLMKRGRVVTRPQFFSAAGKTKLSFFGTLCYIGFAAAAFCEARQIGGRVYAGES